MKLLNKLSLILFLFTLISCNKEDYESEEYTPIQVSPVKMDLTQVPYPKLSDYNFFEGEIKNQKPVYGVIPYKPESELFTDYAEKQRFVWLPKGTSANYTKKGVLDFPNGAILIKNFFLSSQSIKLPFSSRKAFTKLE